MSNGGATEAIMPSCGCRGQGSPCRGEVGERNGVAIRTSRKKSKQKVGKEGKRMGFGGFPPQGKGKEPIRSN